LDDITWGTKGTDREAPSDLGNVVQDSNSRIDLEIEPEAPNDLYVEALENLRTKKPLPRTPGGLSEGEKDQIRRDYYANLRTNVSVDSHGIKSR
jgi:chitin synthase